MNYDKTLWTQEVDEDGRHIYTPVKQEVVPRLAKAPRHTPIQVRDNVNFKGCIEWTERVFVRYKASGLWCAGSNWWKHARLIPGYEYRWNTDWELFMEDDLKVRIWRTNGVREVSLVKDFFGIGKPGRETIVAFEVIER